MSKCNKPAMLHLKPSKEHPCKVHHKTEDKLEKALTLGGFCMFVLSLPAISPVC
jgi:hypothetical protein